VRVGSSYAWKLMAHRLGPEQVGDACFFHPGLLAGPQAARRKPVQDWQRAARIVRDQDSVAAAPDTAPSDDA
jgi:hypothetical protein